MRWVKQIRRRNSLRYLKKLRQLKQEILMETNEGRVRHLAFSLPRVRSIHVCNDGYCEIALCDGWDVHHNGKYQPWESKWKDTSSCVIKGIRACVVEVIFKLWKDSR